ncbi:MAG TPA: hypothetical protein VJ954_03965, partial [Ignavibacteriaceae bacterium]|nr:hypothetical protein [Ignavibacteriaceae bacterium]
MLNLSIDDINQKSDMELEVLFSNNKTQTLTPKLKTAYDFFPNMEREIKKTGVTRQSVWEEYYKKHSGGLKVSQFCEHYRRWSKRVNTVRHMNHKAGDKIFIDYVGKTLEVVDKLSGEVEQVQFYVSILGASQYTYAEASRSQQKEDLVTS